MNCLLFIEFGFLFCIERVSYSFVTVLQEDSHSGSSQEVSYVSVKCLDFEIFWFRNE